MKFAPAALLAALATASCTNVASQPEPQMSALDQALSVRDFDASVAELAHLPYLPWTYTIDGCYARALYYSMLLVTKDIPTNHLYSVAQRGTRLGGIWRWHVAPLVTKEGEPNTLYVLDPVYDKTRALTSLEWIARQNYTDTSARDYPTLHVHGGNSYGVPYDVELQVTDVDHPAVATYGEPTYTEMPAFVLSEVDDACVTMHDYIERETGTTSTERATKHRELADVTVRFTTQLTTRSKLDRDVSALSRACTAYATPVTPVAAVPDITR